MPYYRRRYTTYRRRRPYTRYRRRTTFKRYRRFRRRVKQGVFYYTRFASLQSIDLDPTTEVNLGYSFNLTQLPNYTEFTQLYDSYKIKAVKLTFYPSMTQSVSTSTVNAPLGDIRVITAIDRNDNTAVDLNALRQYKSARVHPINKRFSRYIYRPMILTNDSYTINPWMATTNPSEAYYGLKFGAEATSQSTGDYGYRVEAKFYLAFRAVR